MRGERRQACPSDSLYNPAGCADLALTSDLGFTQLLPRAKEAAWPERIKRGKKESQIEKREKTATSNPKRLLTTTHLNASLNNINTDNIK